MPQWPIRVKLIAGLSLVVGMMLTLMGGSIFGLHSFHIEQPDARRPAPRAGGVEGAARARSSGSNAPRDGTPRRSAGRSKRGSSRHARRCSAYFRELKKNTTRGNRADDGRDELGLAFLIDDDLTAILAELDPDDEAGRPLFPGTTVYLSRHPECCRRSSRPRT